MANDGRLEPIENGNFRVYNSADQVVGAIEKSEKGYQPIHADGDVGPVADSAEQAADYLLTHMD